MDDFISKACHLERGLVANSNAATAYELTAAAGGCAGAIAHVPAQEPPPQMPQPTHDLRKKNFTHFNSEGFNMPTYETPLPVVAPPPPTTTLVPTSAIGKRKPSSFGTASTYDEDEDSKSSRTGTEKKQNHSEIEKRRRDKMNTYITELSSMIPMCGAMARKLDKLTVLRMAVQHLRSVRGALTACPLTARPRPSFLSERELNAIILHAAQDCFIIVVGCDRGRLLYVSASVKKILHYDQSELLGQSLFDILHLKDVAKVKEQLSSSDLSPRERLIDIKTMLPVKMDVVAGTSRFSPGARRSFFCRIKCKASPDEIDSPTVKDEAEPAPKIRKKQVEKKYCVVQCTGYLKSLAPIEMSEGAPSTSEGAEDGEASNMSCLVAVGRSLPDLVLASAPQPPSRQLQYVSRHTVDGKFLFVDQRVTLALGFLPQELLGTSLYEYVSGPELGAVAYTHKQALLQREPLQTQPYLFRRKDGSEARIQTQFKPFRNPWTKDVESLVANNTVVADEQTAPEEPETPCYEVFKQNSMPSLASEQSPTTPSDLSGISEVDSEMQRLIDSQLESHKIGTAIVEEALRHSSAGFSPELPTDLLQEAAFSQQASLENMFGVGLNSEVRNNVPLSAAGAGSSPLGEPEEQLAAGSPLPPLGVDGNGEAAMAVIMSLLEADAGLGGPVNFAELPWPLP